MSSGHELVVAGFDGGGTRTRCALADASGRVLGSGESGPGNLHDVGAERLRAHLSEAWEGAWRDAGRAPTAVAAGFLGMASVVTEADRATVQELARGLGVSDDVGVDHDLSISLAGGLGGGDGIAVIAGTGSSCFGRGPDGRTWMAGGWGSFLDDRGSAFDMGRGALVACARASDGRGPRTSMEEPVRRALGIETWREMLSRIDADGMTRSEIAALAPIVTRAASEGDEAARALLCEGTRELALCVHTVARHIELEAPRVVATGGLAQAREWREPFAVAVKERLPDASVLDCATTPLIGACLLAFERRGHALDERARGRLLAR